MRGNSHVQFLGGWARATAPGYPATLESYARDDRLQTRTQTSNCSKCWRGKYASRLAKLASAITRARQPSPAYWTRRRVKGPLAPGFGLPLTRYALPAREAQKEADR